jgi:hypothetical protein
MPKSSKILIFFYFPHWCETRNQIWLNALEGWWPMWLYHNMGNKKTKKTPHNFDSSKSSHWGQMGIGFRILTSRRVVVEDKCESGWPFWLLDFFRISFGISTFSLVERGNQQRGKRKAKLKRRREARKKANKSAAAELCGFGTPECILRSLCTSILPVL